MKVRYLTLTVSVVVGAGLVLAAFAQRPGISSSTTELGKGKKETRKEIDGPEMIRKRAEWFYRQRAYPLKHIPAFARERAWDSFRQMQEQRDSFLRQKFGASFRREAAAAAQAAGTVNTAGSWTLIGPQPTNELFFEPSVSGRVTAMVVDPCDSTGNTVFLGGAQGGLWLTKNAGQAWTPLTDQASSLAVGSLAVPPASPTACVGTVSKTVYVGTGEGNFSLDSYYGAGVLICTTSDGSSYSCTHDQTLGAFNQSHPLTQDSGGPYIGSLAVDPQNPQVMLAAVRGSGSTLQSGVWCSSNAGTNWTQVLPGGVTGVVGTAVGFDPAGFGYAALGNLDGGAGNGTTTVNGIYKTGAALTTDCAAGNVSDRFTKLGGLDNAAGGAQNLGRISLSVYSTSTSSSTNDVLFASVASASSDSDNLLGVFKSTNGGSTWTQPSTQSLVTSSGGFCNGQCWYDLAIAIDPANSNVIYTGGSAPPSHGGGGATLIASTDGGSTWTDISGNDINSLCTNLNPTGCLFGIHVDLHAIAFKANGSGVYVGSDGGAWSTTNPASPSQNQAWTDLNTTLALSQFYPGMSNNPGGWQYRSFGGTQDNGLQVYGQNSGTANPLAWDDELFCGDGTVTLVDPMIPSTVYGSCTYVGGSLVGIGKSVLNGDVDDTAANYFSSFNDVTGNLGSITDAGSFVPPMAIDPEETGSTGDAQTLYFGTYRVWQTMTGGTNWTAISPDVTGADSANNNGNGALSTFCSNNPGYCVLMTVAVAPTNSNEVATGSDVGEIYLSQNALQGASATWSDVSSSVLPARSVTHVAFDPSNAGIIYATYSGFSGFGGDTAGHAFVGAVVSGSTVNWTDISSGLACTAPAGNLPNIPANDIVVDPDHPTQLFVATDVGVYVGTLQGTAPTYTGACWQPLGSGLPNSAVLSLTLNDASRTLIVGTHGRSSWVYNLGDQPAFSLGGLMPASAQVGGAAFTMKLTGTGFTSSSKVTWAPAHGAAVSLSQTSASGCSLPTCMAVQVSNTLLGTGGVVQVSVTDPSQTNATNAVPFTVTSQVPTITSISPTTGTSNNALNLTLTGSGFASGATVGLQTEVSPLPCSPLTPASQTATQLTVSASANCMQYGGVLFVTANNPTPGGGSSNPNLLATSYAQTTACPNSNPSGCLVTVMGAAPANGSFSSAASVTGSTFTMTEDTSGAPNGTNPPIPSSCTSTASINDFGDLKSVWFKFTPSSNTTAEFDTIGSNYDTILSVWTGSSVNSLTNVACDDDLASGASLVSQIPSVNLAGGTTYYIMVSDWGVPVYDSSGNITNILASGGKLVFNMSTSASSSLAYTASASAPNPSTVTAGGTATTTLTLTPTSGSGTVTVQPCTTSPSTTTITCSYASNSVALSGSAQTDAVTISTTARSGVPPAAPFQSPPWGWFVVVMAAGSIGAFLLKRRQSGSVPVRSAVAAAVGFALLAGVLLFSGACGGGSSSGGGGGGGGTPAGTYTITIPTSPAPSGQSASVTLTVQ